MGFLFQSISSSLDVGFFDSVQFEVFVQFKALLASIFVSVQFQIAYYSGLG